MILVSVGNDDAAYLVSVLLQIGVVRDDQIHAQHIAVGESHAAVDDDDVVLTLEHGQILAYLVQTAEESHPHRGLLRLLLLPAARVLSLCIGRYRGLEDRAVRGLRFIIVFILGLG